jgi:beta-ureidopropionase / N-carbamoyl-L-amino-acid hydrolase
VTVRDNLRIDLDRLAGRIGALGQVGAIEGGGVSRLALSDSDKAGRDTVSGWMRELGLGVTVDAIGNVVGLRKGRTDGAPVMMGSHIDTVATGGRYDGNLGVLAGLEVINTLNDAGIETERPVAVAFFTNEEGSRFQPDMFGSLVYVGALDLETALATKAIDGPAAGEELKRIGYAGPAPVGKPNVHAYLEYHVEQGPVLEAEGFTVGAVTGVQGISWTEYTIEGVSNHAGTTPMRLRCDAGYAAAAIAVAVRRIAKEIGGDQVGTVGAITLSPNLVNVVANKAVMTVDLRNTDEATLQDAERRVAEAIEAIRTEEGVTITARRLARFEPVAFAPAIVDRVEALAKQRGHKVKRLPSGAGHDAQMLARVCPAGMIFVPSAGGISHNVKEYTSPSDIGAGADILLHLVLELAGA